MNRMKRLPVKNTKPTASASINQLSDFTEPQMMAPENSTRTAQLVPVHQEAAITAEGVPSSSESLTVLRYLAAAAAIAKAGPSSNTFSPPHPTDDLVHFSALASRRHTASNNTSHPNPPSRLSSVVSDQHQSDILRNEYYSYLLARSALPSLSSLFSSGFDKGELAAERMLSCRNNLPCRNSIGNQVNLAMLESIIDTRRQNNVTSIYNALAWHNLHSRGP